MIEEIREIPEKAQLCYQKNKEITLPEYVPYIGMGSSYFAPLTLKYLGCNIFPEIASEYFNYTFKNKKNNLAVLLSQSGASSETIWNIEKFKEYIAIVNNLESPLAKSEKAKEVIDISAGVEKHSSTKTYVNTLITLYQGLGIDTLEAINVISNSIRKYEEWGDKHAEIIFNKYKNGTVNGIYVIGNGPNSATAYEAALIFTESTKIPFIPMALPQYDHGPKESANNCIVLTINADGPVKDRTNHLLNVITGAGATSIVWEENDVPESISPITSIVPMNCLAYSLARKLGIKETFAVGGKITTVDDNLK